MVKRHTSGLNKHLLAFARYERRGRIEEMRAAQKAHAKIERKEDVNERQRERSDKAYRRILQRISSIEREPSRMGFKQLQMLLASGALKPLEKAHVSGILLRWSAGDFTHNRRKPRARSQKSNRAIDEDAPLGDDGSEPPKRPAPMW